MAGSTALKKKKNKRIIKIITPPDPFNNDPSKIDYKDTSLLKKFITTRGRLKSTETTGVTPKCQRKLSKSVKRARYIALLPFTQYV